MNHVAAITHFSHIHTLHLLGFIQSTSYTCAFCTLRVSGDAYSCKTCYYVLHPSCAELQQRIHHPIDPSHALILTDNSHRNVVCDVCNGKVTGFAYGCAMCDLDVHTFCARLQSSVYLRTAHPHPLALASAPPLHYRVGFTCNLCRGIGGKHWLYRCDSCQFDAHIHCATQAVAREQSQVLQQQHNILARSSVGTMGVGNSGPQGAPVINVPQVLQQQYNIPARPVAVGTMGVGNSGPQGAPVINVPQMLQQQYNIPARPVAVGTMGVGNSFPQGAPVINVPQVQNNIDSNLLNDVCSGLVSGVSNQVGQTLMQSVIGGNGINGGGIDEPGGDGAGDDDGDDPENDDEEFDS